MTKIALLAECSLLALVSLATACGGGTTTVAVTQVNAANSEKPTADKVKGYAQTTPPTGATSMGMMSSPTAGSLTIPITNIEVFAFSANVDSSPGDETMYWAVDGSYVYVWGQVALECVDDNGAPTGETGVADVVYEADGASYGWMTSTDSCGYSTDFGCSNDGNGEVCGGCDWNASFVACVAAT